MKVEKKFTGNILFQKVPHSDCFINLKNQEKLFISLKRNHKKVVDKSRRMRFQTLFEHFRTMTLNVYFLLLALSVYAAPDSIAKLQEILNSTKMIKSVMKANKNIRIPTPVHQNIADCASTIFEGIDHLEKHPEMKQFSSVFLTLKSLKTSLQKNMKIQERCDTENVAVFNFINTLERFIRTQYPRAKQ